MHRVCLCDSACSVCSWRTADFSGEASVLQAATMNRKERSSKIIYERTCHLWLSCSIQLRSSWSQTLSSLHRVVSWFLTGKSASLSHMLYFIERLDYCGHWDREEGQARVTGCDKTTMTRVRRILACRSSGQGEQAHLDLKAPP